MQYRLLALMVAIAITPATAAEEPRTNLGTLTCTLTKSPEAEARNITCGFKPAGSGPEQKYTGSVHGRAQDAATGKLVLVWTVIGPAGANLPEGLLAQRYVKAVGVAGHPHGALSAVRLLARNLLLVLLLVGIGALFWPTKQDAPYEDEFDAVRKPNGPDEDMPSALRH
jgi:hypothetical protein